MSYTFLINKTINELIFGSKFIFNKLYIFYKIIILQRFKSSWVLRNSFKLFLSYSDLYFVYFYILNYFVNNKFIFFSINFCLDLD
jgi:hypothetical protein